MRVGLFNKMNGLNLLSSDVVDRVFEAEEHARGCTPNLNQVVESLRQHMLQFELVQLNEDGTWTHIDPGEDILKAAQDCIQRRAEPKKEQSAILDGSNRKRELCAVANATKRRNVKRNTVVCSLEDDLAICRSVLSEHVSSTTAPELDAKWFQKLVHREGHSCHTLHRRYCNLLRLGLCKFFPCQSARCKNGASNLVKGSSW